MPCASAINESPVRALSRQNVSIEYIKNEL
jgi:hypothetical protein